MPACRARADSGSSGLLEGKKISTNCRLWIFTSRAVKAQADSSGLLKTIADAGGVLMTDTCSAFAQAIATGHEGRRARFGEADALSAGDPRHSGLVRIDDGLHQRGAHGPVVRRTAMTVSTTIVLRGRKVYGGRAEGEALVTRETVPGWGGVNPVQGRHHRNAARASRSDLQGQGAGVSRCQGIVGLVGDVPHRPSRRHGADRRWSSTR